MEITPTGVLVYTARIGDQNQVSVTRAGSDYVVADVVPIDDTTPPGGCTVSANTATCPAGSVARIRIDARDGNDVFAIDPAIGIPASFIGGAGLDTVDYSSSTAGGVDVNLSAGAVDRSGGPDKLSLIENVTGTNSDDKIDVRNAGVNAVTCGDGVDSVRSDPTDSVSTDCEHVDNGVPPVTQIDSGPQNPTNAATIQFTFSATGTPAANFVCKLNDVVTDDSCSSPKIYTAPDLAQDGDYTFEVAAVDEFGNQDSFKSYLFTIDRNPPDTDIGSPASDGETFNTASPTFQFSSPDPDATFECAIDETVYTSCGSPFTVPGQLANGDHKITVAAKDKAGNIDQTPAERTFRIDAPIPPPPPPPGPEPPAPQPQVTTSSTVIFGSLVLISGRSVKLVKGKLVPVSLTCSGQRRCSGRLTITSDRPVKKTRKKKKSKRLERLGSTQFAIEGNRSAKVLVPLSGSKARLIKKLKRLKARATIREIDVHGHPRISTRTFLLRAR